MRTFGNDFKNMFVIMTLALAGCTTAAQSNPPRTATEQLLISTAADRAAAQLAVRLQDRNAVFVDSSNFDGTDAKYAVATIRDSLLRQGVQLVDDKKNAHTIIELRAGALSTDKNETLVGIPSFNIPVPFASSPLPFPEIALYKDDDQEGVAKFAFTAYDAKNGGLRQSATPQFGFSHNEQQTVMIFVSWSSDDIMPQDNKDLVGRSLSNAHGSTGNDAAPPLTVIKD